MIYVKGHKQRDIFNPFAPLGTKRLALFWNHRGISRKYNEWNPTILFVFSMR
jgi:hypothetical protein